MSSSSSTVSSTSAGAAFVSAFASAFFAGAFFAGGAPFFARLGVCAATGSAFAVFAREGRSLLAALASALTGAFAVVVFVSLAVLTARLAGAEAFVAFTAFVAFAGVRLAGVLVAVRFTGSLIAGLAFVAATYSLSPMPTSPRREPPAPATTSGRLPRAMSNVGVLSVLDTRRSLRFAAAVDHCNDSARSNPAQRGDSPRRVDLRCDGSPDDARGVLQRRRHDRRPARQQRQPPVGLSADGTARAEGGRPQRALNGDQHLGHLGRPALVAPVVVLLHRRRGAVLGFLPADLEVAEFGV